jgi:prophage regulatory protein
MDDKDPTDRFISVRQVVDLTSLSRTTIWRAGRAGAFPRPHRLTPGRVGFSEAAVREWIVKRQLAERASDHSDLGAAAQP